MITRSFNLHYVSITHYRARIKKQKLIALRFVSLFIFHHQNILSWQNLNQKVKVESPIPTIPALRENLQVRGEEIHLNRRGKDNFQRSLAVNRTAGLISKSTKF